jgi:hypothetical protein
MGLVLGGSAVYISGGERIDGSRETAMPALTGGKTARAIHSQEDLPS